VAVPIDVDDDVEDDDEKDDGEVVDGAGDRIMDVGSSSVSLAAIVSCCFWMRVGLFPKRDFCRLRRAEVRKYPGSGKSSKPCTDDGGCCNAKRRTIATHRERYPGLPIPNDRADLLLLFGNLRFLLAELRERR
jgi:hypothetical protein